MNQLSRIAFLSLGLLSSLALAQEGSGTRYAIVPFAALSGEVPQRAGTKAAAMLSTEIKNTDGLALVDAKKTAAPDPYEAPLARARNLTDEATELRKKRKFNQAEEALKKALPDLLAAGPGISDIGVLVDAYALLSAVQFNTGRDEEGQQSLVQALSLAPTRELPLAQTSALFARVVQQTRRQVVQAPKGSLQVLSIPPGAGVTVDGVALGNTPLVVKDVPPGMHVWRVQLPSGEVTGGSVEVAAEKQAKVTGTTTGTDPEARMLAALAQNKLDDKVLAAAKEHATAANAEMLIFGALSREGKQLALDSFLFQPASNEVKRLPRRSFDTELLSAGMEFYNLAGELARQGLKVGEATRFPGPVAAGPVPEPKVNEVRYGQQAGAESGLDVDLADPAKKPGETKRKPLIKK